MTPEAVARQMLLAELVCEAQVVSGSVLNGDLEEARFRARLLLAMAEPAGPSVTSAVHDVIDRLGPYGGVQVLTGCGAALLMLANALADAPGAA